MQTRTDFKTVISTIDEEVAENNGNQNVATIKRITSKGEIRSVISLPIAEIAVTNNYHCILDLGEAEEVMIDLGVITCCYDVIPDATELNTEESLQHHFLIKNDEDESYLVEYSVADIQEAT